MTRRRLILAGVVVLALAASFATGRYTRTVATRDVVRTETQWKDREVVKVVHDVQTVHDVATQTRTVVVTKWSKAPDGTPVVTQESHQERAQQVETKVAARTATAKERTAEGQQSVVETHSTESRPTWSATALVGVQDGGSRLLSAIPVPIVAGVVLERRLIGPVSLGFWGTTAKAGGLSVSLSF
jgi:hypothetical protein